ncbi:hypothetical protein HLV35_05320 [Eggerthellaceae bacterium zg-997]|nr:hypothetical protein [Eggerthellaceae bacterium zg-997]
MPKSFARMLCEFPDDDQVREWRRLAVEGQGDESGAPAGWGEGLAWFELHHSTPYPYSID